MIFSNLIVVIKGCNNEFSYTLDYMVLLIYYQIVLFAYTRDPIMTYYVWHTQHY